MTDITVSSSFPVAPRSLLMPASSPPPGQNFQTYLLDAVGEVNALDEHADHAIEQFVGEGTGDLQDVIIAMEKADISFEFMMQIRNKALDAYQEIMRMQV